jgi:NlpC/P60 family putative phage cell wall peptidase
MVTRAQIVECARTFLGTRWQHQARLKGVACDCAGLVICIGEELFGIRADVPAYGHTPNHGQLERIVSQYMRKKSFGETALGDVLLMTWDQEPHHMAIVSEVQGEMGIIHSYAQVKKVVEHRLDTQWANRIRAVFEFPSVE